jgi:CDP-diglyceride synthetase
MKKFFNENKLMMFSNIFLLLPVIYAFLYHQWIYFCLASGLLIFSPLYHWYKITKPTSFSFKIYKKLDWLFAVGAFLYMYYYIYRYIQNLAEILLYFLLSLILLFFWYGYKRGDYEKTHPYFHIIAPMISSAILIIAN